MVSHYSPCQPRRGAAADHVEMAAKGASEMQDTRRRIGRSRVSHDDILKDRTSPRQRRLEGTARGLG